MICFRCKTAPATIRLQFGKVEKYVCQACRYTPQQSRKFRREEYRRAIRRAVPDIVGLPEHARLREELAAKARHGR